MKLRLGEPKEVGMSAERIQRLRRLAEGWVDDGLASALVVLIARHGVVVLHDAFGRLTPEPESPPLPLDAIFPLVSLSKPVTATAAMILVEDGLLGLNRPVAEYIPEFVGENKNLVTVHQLMTHTAGLDVEYYNLYVQTKSYEAVDLSVQPTQHPRVAAYLAGLYSMPLAKPPGVEMHYSSHGMELLGEIVRRVSGQSLAEFARARIFEPLGMRDTSYGLPESARSKVVRRAPADPDDAFLDTPVFQETPWAGGGVFSTAWDMATFAQAFLDQGCYGEAMLLSPASVAEMTRNQIPGLTARFLDETFREASWGYGWSIRGPKHAFFGGSLYSPAAFEHAGAGGVFLWADPTYDLVGVYFSAAMLGGKDDIFVNLATAAIVDGTV
jgi:CubicO group peptidase (beta-lactamase class C family)